jgi:hypothetical protein
MSAPTHYALDFAHPTALHASRGRLLVLVACAVCVAVASWAHDAWLERQTQADRVERLHAARARQVQAPVRPAAAPTPATQTLRTDLAKVAHDLHKPWPALLDALETARDPQVQLQQVSVDASFVRAQVQIEALSLAQVLAYVRVLDRAPWPARGAQLLSHEWVGTEGASAAAPRRLRARVVLALDARARSPAPAASEAQVACASPTCARAGRAP